MPADYPLSTKQIAKLPRTKADNERGWRHVHLYRARLQKHAMKTLAGLYADPKDPDYNPDAGRTWSECTMKTRAALVMAKDMGLTGDPDSDGRQVLGVLVVQSRAESIPTWEAEAKLVDQEERQKAIEAEFEPVPAKEAGTDVPT